MSLQKRHQLKNMLLAFMFVLLLNSPLIAQAVTLNEPVPEPTPEEQPITESTSDGRLSTLEVINLIFFSLAGICLIIMLAATYLWIVANYDGDQIDRARDIWHVGAIAMGIIVFIWIAFTYLVYLLKGLQEKQ